MNKNLPSFAEKFERVLAICNDQPRDEDNVALCDALEHAFRKDMPTVGDLRALVEYLNSVRADCKDFQCQQVHDYMDSLAKSLGIEVDAGLLSVIKSTIIQQEISRLQKPATGAADYHRGYETGFKMGQDSDLSWQPIATAPHDGRQIVIWVEAPSHPFKPYAMVSKADGNFTSQVTHWHPLPEPPKQPRTSTIPEEIKAVESESEIDWASYKLSRDPFAVKQSAYEPVKQKWVSHIGPFPAGYQVAAEHVGWLSFCEGVEYGKQLKP